MTGPDILDNTTDDYDRLETELVAQDRDAARVETANIDERSARRLVGELIEDDVVTPVPDQRILLHEPSSKPFESTTQLAVFHRGWRAAKRGGRLIQQTRSGCAFWDSPPGSEMGKAHTWGKDEQVTQIICVDCAVQERPDPEERDHHACDGCGLVVDALAALTRFRVELGHLEGPLRLCACCSPGGPATYWTRDLTEHLVAE